MQSPEAPRAPETSTEEKLLAVRAQRAALAAERAAAEAAAATAEALAREERALRDDAAIFAAEKAHGKQGEKIFVVKDVGVPACDVVILKRPNAVAFKGFQDLDKAGIHDVEQLVLPCVVYPSKDVFDRLHSLEVPGLLTRCARAVAYLAGMRKADEQGKA